MVGESGVTRSMIDEFHFWDMPVDQMEVERGLSQSIIDELHYWDIQGYQK